MIERFLEDVRAWAATDARVAALALVGSRARGQARPDSDVDLVVLCAEPESLLRERDWLSRFGAIRSHEREEWGRVTSLRVHYRGGLELEFGIARPDWASDPDDGTRRVVADGCLVLWDPHGLFAPLLRAHSQRA